MLTIYREWWIDNVIDQLTHYLRKQTEEWGQISVDGRIGCICYRSVYIEWIGVETNYIVYIVIVIEYIIEYIMRPRNIDF